MRTLVERRRLRYETITVLGVSPYRGLERFKRLVTCNVEPLLGPDLLCQLRVGGTRARGDRPLQQCRDVAQQLALRSRGLRRWL